MPSAAWEAMKVVLDARAEGRDEDAERLLAQPELEDIGWWCARTNRTCLPSPRTWQWRTAVTQLTPRARFRKLRNIRRAYVRNVRDVHSVTWLKWLPMPTFVEHVDVQRGIVVVVTSGVYRQFNSGHGYTITVGQNNALGLNVGVDVIIDPNCPPDRAYVMDTRPWRLGGNVSIKSISTAPDVFDP